MRARSIVVVGVVTLAACGAPSTLDGPEAEAGIGDRLAETYDVEVGQVTCPDDVEVAEGATFTCEADVGDAGSVSVEVRQTDGEGALEVEAEMAIISTERVADDIATTLADRFARDDVAVTCAGPAVRLEAPDATFTCEAVDGDETKQVEVRVRDTRGALAYTLVEE